MLRITADPAEFINIMIDEIIRAYEIQQKTNAARIIYPHIPRRPRLTSLVRSEKGKHYARKITLFHDNKEYEIAALLCGGLDSATYESFDVYVIGGEIGYVSKEGEVFFVDKHIDGSECIAAYCFADWETLQKVLSALDTILGEIKDFIFKEYNDIEAKTRESIKKYESYLSEKYSKAWGKFRIKLESLDDGLYLYFENEKLMRVATLKGYFRSNFSFMRAAFLKDLEMAAFIENIEICAVPDTIPHEISKIDRKELKRILWEAVVLNEEYLKELERLREGEIQRIIKEKNERIVDYLGKYKETVERIGIEGILMSAELEKY